MDQRPGAKWLGLPTMIGVLAFFAALSAVPGLAGLLIAGVVVLLLILIIGAAMTFANKQQ
jgi:hypothetical protein